MRNRTERKRQIGEGGEEGSLGVSIWLYLSPKMWMIAILIQKCDLKISWLMVPKLDTGQCEPFTPLKDMLLEHSKGTVCTQKI